MLCVGGVGLSLGAVMGIRLGAGCGWVGYGVKLGARCGWGGIGTWL